MLAPENPICKWGEGVSPQDILDQAGCPLVLQPSGLSGSMLSIGTGIRPPTGVPGALWEALC